MSQGTTYQNLFDLIVKNKVYESCHANLVSFLLERDPLSLVELTTLGDQYYAAHPASKILKETSFRAFACESMPDDFEEEEVDTYGVQRFNRDKPPHQGRPSEIC